MTAPADHEEREALAFLEAVYRTLERAGSFREAREVVDRGQVEKLLEESAEGD